MLHIQGKVSWEVVAFFILLRVLVFHIQREVNCEMILILTLYGKNVRSNGTIS